MALFLFLLFCHPSPALSDFVDKVCEGRNSISDPTFQTNLNHLLSSLSLSLTSTNSTFNNSTRGSSPNFVYGLFLCRGDVGPNDCHVCVQTAIENAPSLCPNRTQVTLFYDTCQLRYSDNSFFSSSGNIEPLPYPSGPTADDPDTFAMLVKELMTNLSKKAAYDSSGLRFAAGELVYSGANEVRLFGMAECTRDLSMDTCQNCLQEILGDYWNCCVNQSYGGLLGKSCNFRYDGVKFFNGKPTVMINWSDSASSPPAPALSPMIPSPSIPTTGKDHGNNGHKIIIIISIVVILVMVLVLTLASYIYFRRRSTTETTQSMARPEDVPISVTESLYYDLFVLKVATSNFSEANKLGQGGFGKVYKGILPNGEIVAVKRLSASSRQGIGELKNELLLVAKLQHRNLVRLRGVCLEGGERLLVYEFLPNGSLDKFLFDHAKSQELNWEMRFKIIGGIARGLAYLHEESHLKVIHRDLKASNVLLDVNMKPKISDFGLARLFHDETQGITSRVVGTFGYMAPEYARRGIVSIKLDVYSYGILVLEIVTGKKNSSFKYESEEGQDVLGYAWEHWRAGRTLAIIDPTLGENYPGNEVLRCIQIGLLCAQEVPVNRPSMSTVFYMLNSPSMPLQIPTRPTFLAGLSKDTDSSSSKQSYFGSTGGSSTSSLLGSQQSGSSNTQNSQESGSGEKKVVQIELTNNRTTVTRRSRLSQSETCGST